MRGPHVYRAVKITDWCAFPPSSIRDVLAIVIELWRIFHDELDLDGNGHLDADELASALQKAGM